MSNKLWQPTEQQIKNAQMTQFMEYVNMHCQQSNQDYDALYQWSIDFPEAFWPALADFCKVHFTQTYEKVVEDPDKMPGAKWFVGGTLNFAEHLLRHHKEDKTALIFTNELGERHTLTYPELYREVAKFTQALNNAGIKLGDRIAAVLPNMPETIIVMLAASSIGAIFSSCSPDFGAGGLIDRFSQITPKLLVTVDGYTYKGKSHSILEKIKEVHEKIPSIEKVVVKPYLETSPNISMLKNANLFETFNDNDASKIQFNPLPFDHPLYIVYSSGTTGAPKCIVHGAGGVLLQHLKELVLHTDLKASDTLFYFTTCGWMMWNWFVSGLATGASIVLYDGSPFHPKEDVLIDLIEKESVTVFGTSAKYISALEKYDVKPMQKYSLSNLRTILSTGSPLLPNNFDYVYQHIKKDLCLSSISGGTDIVSCFALGNPVLPVHRGELQSRGLGLKVEVYNESGESIKGEKGELVCVAPFPAMPICFWNDDNQEKYHKAYFERYPGIWAHGDHAKLTEPNGMVIYGRSDALLKPGGVRIGTAEIYREVEKFDQITDSVAIGQEWHDDTRIILFVTIKDNAPLDDELISEIRSCIRKNASPHHVPAKVIAVNDIPRTLSGKIMELAVRDIVHGKDIKNKSVIANPEALDNFKNIEALTH